MHSPIGDSSEKNIRSKYNQIYSKCKTEKDAQNQSGASPSSWIYWNIFDPTQPKGTIIQMPNVRELGHGEEIVINEYGEPNEESKKKARRPENNTLNEYGSLKMKAFESLIRMNQSDSENAEKDLKQEVDNIRSEISSIKTMHVTF